MAIVPLGGERFVDTSTGRTFSTTGGGYFAGNPEPQVDAQPQSPASNGGSAAPAATAATQSIKVATPDIMIGKAELVPIEIMTNLIFEDIGGQEIINIARTDLVNGQNIIYQPISNLAEINSQYNSKNIMSLENTSDTIFNNFPIRLDTHIPTVGNGINGIPVYIKSDNGDLVVEVVNMEAGEQVEVQILTAGSLLDDTIY